MPTRLLIVVILLGLSACGDKEPRSLGAPPRSQAWAAFAPEGENFSVEMPGKPELQPAPSPDPRITSHAYALVLLELGREYMVSYTKLPESVEGGDPRPLLDGGRNGLLKGLGGTLVSESDVALTSHPGREVVFTTGYFPDLRGEASGRVRTYIVADAVYQVGVLSLVGKPIPEDDAQRVFDSFHLIADVKAENPATAAVEWQDWSDEGGRLVVRAPKVLVGDAPNRAKNKWYSGWGAFDFDVVWFKVPHRASVYAVRWVDLPARAVERERPAILDVAAGELSKRSTFTVASNQPFHAGELEGIEIAGPKQPEMEYDAKNVWKAKARLFFAGNRLYEVVATGPEVEFDLPDTQAFLDSFRVAGGR